MSGAQNIFDFARPSTTWRVPRLDELPDSWRSARRVAFDVETYDPDLKALGPGVRRNGYVVGYSFAIEDGPAHYVPMRHALGGNVPDARAAWRYLLDRMFEFSGTLVTSGGAYDLDYFFSGGGAGAEHLGNGVLHSNVKHRDVALCEALCNEFAGKYDLDSMLHRHDLPGKDEDGLRAAALAYNVHPKKELWKLPGHVVGPYATRDVTGPLELARKQETQIEEEDLWRAVDTECRLLPVVTRMRMRGVRVDESRLEQFGIWATKKRDGHFDEFRKEAGLRSFGLDEFRSAKKLDQVVYQVTGKHLPSTDGGNPETKESTLAEIKHPAFRHLVAAKKTDTVLKTFYEGTIRHLVRGRIHASFRQLVGENEGANPDAQDASAGAAFGRMAGSHTNMQNQPNPEKAPELGGRWRSIYVADDYENGDRWVCLDYKQQEPRRGIHWAEFLGLPGARKAGDMLRANPDMDPYAPMVVDTGLPRGQVKILYLAQAYNQGEVALCEALGLPTIRVQVNGRWRLRAGPEGRAVIDRYNERAPYMALLRAEASRRARERRYIRLLDGRRCRFPTDEHGNVLNEGVGLNRLLQGDSGIMTKLVLIELDRLGVPVATVVHDEINFSGSKYRQLAIEVMEGIVENSVPMRVDWGEGSDYAEAGGYGSKKIDGIVHEFRPTSGGETFMESFDWIPLAA